MPIAEKLELPQGYGQTTETLAWEAVRESKPSPELAQRLADLANTKYAEYGITFEASSYSEPGALQPRRVIAWSSFPKDATRFTFAE